LLLVAGDGLEIPFEGYFLFVDRDFEVLDRLLGVVEELLLMLDLRLVFFEEAGALLDLTSEVSGAKVGRVKVAQERDQIAHGAFCRSFEDSHNTRLSEDVRAIAKQKPPAQGPAGGGQS
jgi:hypothetical protein